MNFTNSSNGGNEEGIKMEVNLAPLIDVVLQLVIFFMITTTFTAQSSIKINLPESSSKEMAREQELTVVIAKDKKIYFDNELVSLPLLSHRLRTSMQTGKDKKNILIIKADELAPHGAVVRVMDLGKKLGIETLAIATEVKEDSTT